MGHSTNIFAGVILILSRPFKSGNYIQVASFKGQVVGIDYRYVHILQEDGSVVLVPAYTVLSSPIIVSSTGDNSSQ